MRPRWRSVTDHAASSKLCLALTSTKTRRLRRLATMSISPTGLFQRRARMRKPLAIRKAAARLSAEIPVRNAILLFSCRRSGGERISGPPPAGSSAIVILRAQRQRALIDEPAGGAGGSNNLSDRLLERHTIESRAQQGIEIRDRCFGLRLRRGNDNRDLAAHIRLAGVIAGKRRQIAAPDFLMQLGQFATYGGFPGPKSCCQVRKRRGNARSGLEQDQRCWNGFERGNARAPR